ncbi:sterol desaturase family protein [Pseudomonas vancouverensis]|uniref:Fatty acid hydroxylase family protein n=1 Tax=Pseudomonas vancouverensis TaxID=95300 RepID=A0A1H2NRQ4_PSEVA|nr:sterol desaturase family protein [Pseudomonas vancouverensis]KAB0491160.1 sterol desaturase family protein [Pseudomonas vancouverensis]TDB59628.1 fatty acid hydroxylase family protein [Pseudomonas vancouverensis]SDV08113.1 Fatty acid hydroxylase superfamily protein [Pseudomonas vancouverensis]
MDVLDAVHHYLSAWVIDPVTRQFLGLFDLNGRLCVAFLFISYSVAYALFRFRKARGLTEAQSFGQFIGGARVYFHRSALLDYRYYFVLAILKATLVVPVVALVDPYVMRSGDYLAFFENLWGARTQVQEHLVLSLLFGLGVFLVKDFAHYWLHRAFHSRYLWMFHKVHHSAPVLVPATASRVHFLEEIAEKLTDLLCVGAFAGVFWYLCGGEVSRYTLFGVTYVVFIFNGLASNLRHSHVWLSFGPLLERVLSSPAQHQIHHSDAPRHFDRNFGINLSLWDWLFGTLYLTPARPEAIRFGTGEADHERYLTLHGLIFTPFVDLGRKLFVSGRPARSHLIRIFQRNLRL